MLLFFPPYAHVMCCENASDQGSCQQRAGQTWPEANVGATQSVTGKKCLKRKRGKSEWKHAWMSWKANRGKTERFLLFGAVQQSAVELISKFSGHALGWCVVASEVLIGNAGYSDIFSDGEGQPHWNPTKTHKPEERPLKQKSTLSDSAPWWLKQEAGFPPTTLWSLGKLP